MRHISPIPLQTQVHFDLAQGQATGLGIVLEADYDDGWLYRLQVLEGDRADFHCNERGELWVCAFEVTPTPEPARSPRSAPPE